jgi:hypothetical protein
MAISPALASPIMAPFVKAPVAPVASPTGPTVAQSPTFASLIMALSPVLVAPFVKVDPELTLDSERPLLVRLEALTTTNWRCNGQVSTQGAIQRVGCAVESSQCWGFD